MPKINCNKISRIHNRFSSEDDIFMIEMKSNCGKKEGKFTTKIWNWIQEISRPERLRLSDCIRHGGHCEISEFRTNQSPAFDFEHHSSMYLKWNSITELILRCCQSKAWWRDIQKSPQRRRTGWDRWNRESRVEKLVGSQLDSPCFRVSVHSVTFRIYYFIFIFYRIKKNKN